MKFVGIDELPDLDRGRQAVELAERILKSEKVPHRVILPTEMTTR